MKSIVRVPNSLLTTPAKTVAVFDKKLSRLVNRLKQTIVATKNPRGVGLAAPQIGEPYRVFITQPTESSAIHVFINPRIISFSQEKTDGVPDRTNKFEGCLSIPRIWGKVQRAAAITLRYQNEQGKTRERQFHGYPATIVQHECDHLDGILFTRRVLEQKGKLYQPAKDKDGKEVLEEIEII